MIVVEPGGSGCARRSRGLSWALAVETAPAANAATRATAIRRIFGPFEPQIGFDL
jgi:hypothetical protein